MKIYNYLFLIGLINVALFIICLFSYNYTYGVFSLGYFIVTLTTMITGFLSLFKSLELQHGRM